MAIKLWSQLSGRLWPKLENKKLKARLNFLNFQKFKRASLSQSEISCLAHMIPQAYSPVTTQHTHTSSTCTINNINTPAAGLSGLHRKPSTWQLKQEDHCGFEAGISPKNQQQLWLHCGEQRSRALGQFQLVSGPLPWLFMMDCSLYS